MMREGSSGRSRRIVSSRSVPAPERLWNCFGRSSRESGQSLVPAPPASMTGARSIICTPYGSNTSARADEDSSRVRGCQSLFNQGVKGVLSHFFIAILTQVGIGYQYLRHAIDNAVASFGTALGRGKVDEEKSFLQAVKLQISRSFKLVPYERLAFHRIIGILRTDVGMGILLKDLDAAPDIRRSAIEVLSRFNQPQALAGLAACLKREITDEEKLAILECIQVSPTSPHR